MVILKNKIISNSILVIGFLGVTSKGIYESYERGGVSQFSSYEGWFSFFTNIVLFLIVIVISKVFNKDKVVDQEKLNIYKEIFDQEDVGKKVTETDKVLEKVYRPLRIALISAGVLLILYLIKIMISPGDIEKEFNNLNKMVDVFFIIGLIALIVPILTYIYINYIKRKNVESNE